MAKKSKQLEDIVARHQVYLERLKAGYVKDYEGFVKRLAKDISRLLHDTGSVTTKKQLRGLLRSLRTMQLESYQAHTKKLWSDLEELFTAELLFEKDALKAAVSGVAVKKAADNWALALNNPIQATGDLLAPYLDGLTARQVARVEREIRNSIAQGRTISQTVQAIRGTKAKNYRDGVLGKNWTDARTVVRTSTQHVSTQARVATWEANKDIIDGYQWVSTLDGSTSAACRSLDTEVFEVGKGPLPPIHPNCRSTTVPYFGDDIFDDGATRSAEFGPVGQGTSYYEWLKQQPAAFQDDAIGKTRGKLLRDGGLNAKQFADLQLDKNFKPLTLAEMRELQPNAFERANI